MDRDSRVQARIPSGFPQGHVIPDKLYFKIGEVSRITGLEPYVLRYWEQEFDFLEPIKTKSNQRRYKKKDVELILEIKKLLYDEKFTIQGARKRLKEIKREDKSQLTLNLESRDHKKILQTIKKELEEIISLLD